MADDMAKVRVTRDIPIISVDKDGRRIEGVTTYYPKGWEGTAPRSHIDQIVSSNAGERIDGGPAQSAQLVGGNKPAA